MSITTTFVCESHFNDNNVTHVHHLNNLCKLNILSWNTSLPFFSTPLSYVNIVLMKVKPWKIYFFEQLITFLLNTI